MDYKYNLRLDKARLSAHSLFEILGFPPTRS